MSATREFAASPREVLRALYRHKGKAIFTLFLVLGLTGLALTFWPKRYASDAKLFVRLGRESVALDPTATTGQTISLSETRETEINSILDILGSRALMERVLESVSAEDILGRTYDSPEKLKEKALEKLTRSIGVSAAKRSNVINIHAEASSPELAQKIATAFLQSYMDEHVRMNRTAGSYEFFAEQSKLAQTRLEEATVKLRDAKNEVGVVSIEGQRHLLMTQSAAVIGQLLTAESSLTGERTKVKQLAEEIQRLPARLADDEVSGLPNVAGDGMKQKLYELQLREQEMASKYTETHPLLAGMREQVREAQKLVDAEPAARVQKTVRISRLHENLEFSLKTAEANVAGLEKQITALAGQRDATLIELRKLNDSELKIARLQRETDLAETKAKSYSQKLEEARVNQALDAERISNVNVAQAATLAFKPVSPQNTLVVSAGMLLAVSLALGVALLAEFFDQSLHTPSEAEKHLALPVVSVVPRVASRDTILT